MGNQVHIVVAGKDAEKRVKAALGGSRSSIQFRASASPSAKAAQIFVTLSSELESSALRRLVDATPKTVPLVLLSDRLERAGFEVRVAQRVAFWSARRRQELFVATSDEVMRRLVLALRENATKALIATASLEDDRLVVWSCEPKRYEVAVAEIPALAKMNAAALAHFKVSSSGSRIHWEDGDVDINLDTIRAYVDPETRKTHEQKSRHEASRYADAIRGLREETGLKQGEIGGLSERQVRRIESGKSVPQIDSLKLLAAAHGMATNEYLAALAERSSRRRKKSKRAQQ